MEIRKPSSRGIMAATLAADAADQITILELKSEYMTRLMLGGDSSGELAKSIKANNEEIEQLKGYVMYLQEVVNTEVKKIKEAEGQQA